MCFFLIRTNRNTSQGIHTNFNISNEINKIWLTELKYRCHNFMGMQMKNLEVESFIKNQRNKELTIKNEIGRHNQ